jgi:hypothetical protein
MAAVKRSGESGIIVALVIFAVLGLVGLGLAIWFYQQASAAKQAIQQDQLAFADSVGAHFSASGWDLKEQSPSDLGVRYFRDSYNQVTEKLAVASEYEEEVLPKLGWESLQGFKSAIEASPAQLEAASKGRATYPTMKGLLTYYEDSYTALSKEAAELRAGNERLNQQLKLAQEDLLAAQQRHRQEMTDAAEDYRDKVGELTAANQDLTNRLSRKRQEAEMWTRKHQEEVNGRRQQVSDLEREVAKWRGLYEDEVAPPGEKERLVADGQVIEVWPDYDFVTVEGGRDREVQEDNRFVVYTVTPDGENRKKGVLLIREVYEHTSIATIIEEETYVLKGDSFVSQTRWEILQRGVAPAGSEE